MTTALHVGGLSLVLIAMIMTCFTRPTGWPVRIYWTLVCLGIALVIISHFIMLRRML